MTKHLLPFIFALCAYSCATLPADTHKEVIKIPTGYGPEDLILDTSTGTTRILISCDARRKKELAEHGDIYVLNPETNDAKVLPRTREPEDLVFHPHGIDLEQEGKDYYLYVISHDRANKREFVHKYSVLKDELRFEATFEDPLFVSPNALTANPDGSFFVSNDAGKAGKNGPPLSEMIFKLKRAKVVYCDGKKEAYSTSVATDKLGMGNGIGIQDDKAYVATTGEGVLYQYDVQGNQLTAPSPIVKLKSQDNIRFYEGDILLAAHLRSAAFVRHLQKSENLSPSVIYRIDPNDKSTAIIYANKGEQISAASGAVIYDGYLYVGQIFDPFVLKVRLE